MSFKRVTCTSKFVAIARLDVLAYKQTFGIFGIWHLVRIQGQ